MLLSYSYVLWIYCAEISTVCRGQDAHNRSRQQRAFQQAKRVADETQTVESTWHCRRNRESGLPSVRRPRCTYPNGADLILQSDTIFVVIVLLDVVFVLPLRLYRTSCFISHAHTPSPLHPQTKVADTTTKPTPSPSPFSLAQPPSTAPTPETTASTPSASPKPSTCTPCKKPKSVTPVSPCSPLSDGP